MRDRFKINLKKNNKMNINERSNADLLGKIYRKTGIGSRFMDKKRGQQTDTLVV